MRSFVSISRHMLQSCVLKYIQLFSHSRTWIHKLLSKVCQVNSLNLKKQRSNPATLQSTKHHLFIYEHLFYN